MARIARLLAGVVIAALAVATPAAASLDNHDPGAGPRVGDTGDVWRSVSAGAYHACGLRLDHTIWCWGYGANGRLGVGDREDRLQPTEVGNDTDWASLKAGGGHTCAIKMDHSLWCWGANGYGQLGTGDYQDHKSPVRVGGDADWSMISVSGYIPAFGGLQSFTCGLRLDHSLWCWGNNHNGRLGLGDNTGRTVPTRVGVAADWVAVSTGSGHGCGVRLDDSLWCWGRNTSGQLGVGDTTDRHKPTRVAVAGMDAWSGAALGGDHTCATGADGTLWCWGSGNRGQLGRGYRDHNRSTPGQVGKRDSWQSVSASADNSCAVRNDSSLWCWGANDEGQIGDGHTFQRPRPTRVGKSHLWHGVGVGNEYACARDRTHGLWCWGYNGSGELGIGDRSGGHYLPTRV